MHYKIVRLLIIIKIFLTNIKTIHLLQKMDCLSRSHCLHSYIEIYKLQLKSQFNLTPVKAISIVDFTIWRIRTRIQVWIFALSTTALATGTPSSTWYNVSMLIIRHNTVTITDRWTIRATRTTIIIRTRNGVTKPRHRGRRSAAIRFHSDTLHLNYLSFDKIIILSISYRVNGLQDYIS